MPIQKGSQVSRLPIKDAAVTLDGQPPIILIVGDAEKYQVGAAPQITRPAWRLKPLEKVADDTGQLIRRPGKLYGLH